MMLEKQIDKMQEVQQMTLAEAQDAIGSQVTVGDAVLVLGIACIGIVAWILFNKYMTLRFGKGDNAG